ncbi:glycosyltransferase [Alkalihalobacterium sp. APHAB7]|uniref:glycosyltransferase n=1 Tax=Alkalihalobacterium sp. APHAB7 TaxID=3402081 RepID=UPI003AAEC4C5
MISIITCTIRQENINLVFENYDRQILKEKELIIILNRDEMDINEWQQKAKQYKNVSVFKLPSGVQLGECLNFGIEKSRYDYIAKFDDDDYYAPYYLKEALGALKETNADIVGKHAFFAYIERTKSLVIRFKGQNKFVGAVAGPTLVFKKNITKDIKFRNVTLGEDQLFQKDCRKKGFKIYATSHYNFVLIRKDIQGHTWKIDESEFLKQSKIVTKTNNYQNFVEKDL